MKVRNWTTTEKGRKDIIPKTQYNGFIGNKKIKSEIDSLETEK